MPYFCVNRVAQSGSGDHEVHDLGSTKNCLPATVNRLNLGYFASCTEAVQAARQLYNDVNGCYWCANQCHTT